jgi:hypothetical protein
LSRSSKAQYFRRVNQAYQFLDRGYPPAEVVARLAAEHGASARQAARYVQVAQQQSDLQPIPEAKEPFMVKLPCSLVKRVRQAAGGPKGAISDWVARALEAQLSRARRHG